MPSLVRRGASAAATLIVVLALPLGLRAQGLDAWKTAPSPGFAILGLAPSAIERPTTPTALGLSVVSATGRGSLLPSSYALEIAPYWLKPRPLLTFSERYRPTFMQGVKQSFALSVATDRADESDSSRLGFGARVQLLAGRPSLRTETARDTLSALLTTIGVVADSLDEARAAADSARATAIAARLSELEELEGVLRADFQGRQWNDRVGVRWEVAAAMAAAFPTGTFDGAGITGWGVWSTLSFRPTARSLDVLAVVRYQRLDVATTEGVTGTVEQGVVDAGVRLIHGAGPLHLSGEILARRALDPSDGERAGSPGRYDDSYRLTAGVEYRLTERTALAWTFGRGFAPADARGGELISLLGIKWALGEGLELPSR